MFFYRANISSIGRNEIYWAPFYSPTYFQIQLDRYKLRVKDYSDAYETLVEKYDDCDTFKTNAKEMNDIWKDTIMIRSDIIRDDAKKALLEAETAYLL